MSTLRRGRMTLPSAALLGALLWVACGSRGEPESPRTTQPAPAPGVLTALEAVDSPLVGIPAPGAATTVDHSFFPAQRNFSARRLEQLRAPAGFTVDVYARGLGGPRMLAAAADGSVYVTRPDSGDVVLLRDRDGDGRADTRRTAVSGIDDVHGVAVHRDRLYLADVHHVYAAGRRPDGTIERPREIIDTLPDGGQHPNRTLGVGPDGMLYITVGSLSNAAPGPDTLGATMLQARPDGSGLAIFAKNLRNTLGFGWHPATGELWGMDHGIDGLGDEVQREELNRIRRGADYGWPYCYGRREPNPTVEPPQGWDSLEAYCATTRPMELGYTAHAAPMGMAFYSETLFPAGYRGDAFVAMRGSWNRYPPSGYEIVRVRFDDGRPTAIEPFVSGWLIEDGAAHFGRLAGLAIAPDGSLLVSDDTNGVIYRIAYEGGR